MNRTEATQILMLSSDSTFGDIKYAYRKLSLKLHPDRNKNEKDGRRFKNVLEAYHFLKAENNLKILIIEIHQLKKSQVITIVNIIQKKIGADLQKILKWMKTFGGNMKHHFGMITELEPRKNLK